MAATDIPDLLEVFKRLGRHDEYHLNMKRMKVVVKEDEAWKVIENSKKWVCVKISKIGRGTSFYNAHVRIFSLVVARHSITKQLMVFVTTHSDPQLKIAKNSI
jgi:hypothetical protein